MGLNLGWDTYVDGAADSLVGGPAGTSESHVGHLVDWSERGSVCLSRSLLGMVGAPTYDLCHQRRPIDRCKRRPPLAIVASRSAELWYRPFGNLGFATFDIFPGLCDNKGWLVSRQAADHVLLVPGKKALPDTFLEMVGGRGSMEGTGRRKAHLVCFCFVPIEEPRAHLQLVTRLAGQRVPKVVIHRIGLRQRKVARAGFGTRVVRQEVARVRIFPALVGFVPYAISVTEQDLRKLVSETTTLLLWRERDQYLQNHRGCGISPASSPLGSSLQCLGTCSQDGPRCTDRPSCPRGRTAVPRVC
jgi:hypothetical protein